MKLLPGEHVMGIPFNNMRFPEDPRAPKPEQRHAISLDIQPLSDIPIYASADIPDDEIRCSFATRRRIVASVEAERRYSHPRKLGIVRSLHYDPRDDWDAVRYPRADSLGFEYVRQVVITDEVIARIEGYPEG